MCDYFRKWGGKIKKAPEHPVGCWAPWDSGFYQSESGCHAPKNAPPIDIMTTTSRKRIITKANKKRTSISEDKKLVNLSISPPFLVIDILKRLCLFLTIKINPRQ